MGAGQGIKKTVSLMATLARRQFLSHLSKFSVFNKASSLRSMFSMFAGCLRFPEVCIVFLPM